MLLDRSFSLPALGDLDAIRLPELARIVADIRHQGKHYLVSECLDGVSLARLLGAVTLTPSQAACLAVQTLEAVARLHDAGIGHGRLTAGNVQVGRDGQVRLTDWSLSTLAGTRAPDELRRRDLDHCQELIAELARNADRPVWRGSGHCAELLAVLAGCGAGPRLRDADLSARQLDAALLDALGDGDATAPLAEVAVVVRGLAPAAGSPGRAVERTDASGGVRPSWRRPVPVERALPQRRLSGADFDRADRQRRDRRRQLWIAAAVVLVLVLGTLVYLLVNGPSSY